jgi:hypothetical protein
VTRWYSAGVISFTGENTDAMALLIQTSGGPKAFSTDAAAASTSSASATSAGAISDFPPKASTSSAAAFSPSSPRATSPMDAPRLANARTTARPTPAEAPVTTTTSDRFMAAAP